MFNFYLVLALNLRGIRNNGHYLSEIYQGCMNFILYSRKSHKKGREDPEINIEVNHIIQTTECLKTDKKDWSFSVSSSEP